MRSVRSKIASWMRLWGETWIVYQTERPSGVMAWCVSSTRRFTGNRIGLASAAARSRVATAAISSIESSLNSNDERKGEGEGCDRDGGGRPAARGRVGTHVSRGMVAAVARGNNRRAGPAVWLGLREVPAAREQLRRGVRIGVQAGGSPVEGTRAGQRGRASSRILGEGAAGQPQGSRGPGGVDRDRGARA